jgi:hypothetical protein
LLQPLKVPEWKWEEIGMVFIVGLPRTRDGYDSIWVIVDRLTKVSYFIPVKTTYTGAKLAEQYMSRIVCLHGVPKKISDRGTQFKSRFWEKLHESMDTKLNFSSAYPTQTDGQTEIRVGDGRIRTLGCRIDSFVEAGVLGFAVATTYTSCHSDGGSSFGYMCVVQPRHSHNSGLAWPSGGADVCDYLFPATLATGAWLGPRPRLGYSSSVLLLPHPVSPTTLSLSLSELGQP